MSNQPIDAAIYQDILRRLAHLPKPLYLMGGFAEEVLLDGRITGEHADLDILTTQDQLPMLGQMFISYGLINSVPIEEGSPGRPAVFSLIDARLDLELWGCLPNHDGTYNFELDNMKPHNHFYMVLPVDTFQFPSRLIGDIVIQTVSPLALYLMRATSAMTRHTGEKRVKDIAMQERLRLAFLDGMEDSELSPELVFIE